jgi:histidinol-phosphate aminotransferase
MSQEILNNVRKNLSAIQPYVPGKPIADVKREFGLDEVIKLASNENPLGPSKKAQEAIAQALTELHRYPDGGAVDLKAKLAEKHGVPSNMILVGNGSDDCIKLISETFVSEGDEVVMPNPSFSQYWFGTQLMAGTPVFVNLQPDTFEYDMEALLAAITNKTKIVYLCSPNNPTGTYIKKDAMESFLKRVPTHVLVIVDEAYNEYVTKDDYAQGIDFLKAGYNVIVLRTFSKLYALAGLRVGYAIGQADVLAEINRVREPFNVNMLAQVAAMAALDDEEHVVRSRELNRAGFEQLKAGLGELGYSVVPSVTNFLLFNTHLDDKALFQALLRRGVIVRSGSALGVPGYLRVSIGTAEENAKFLENFREVVSEFTQKV